MTNTSDTFALQPPRFLLVDTTLRCNQRCGHCMHWKLDDPPADKMLSIDRRNELIREFAGLNPNGTVVICGGDNMLQLDRYFAITETCRASGLQCFSVITGLHVSTETMADRMINEGPTAITVSLNSHQSEVHDQTRGMPGAFDRVVAALRLLLESRARHHTDTPIYAMAVICEQNYRELDAFYDFVLNDIGADKLKLNFLQPTFQPPSLWFRDRFFEKNRIHDTEALGRIIQACDAKYGLQINPIWLEQIKMYYRSVRKNGLAGLGFRRGKGTEEHMCNSYERNIMIDLEGNARLCFYHGFPATKLTQPGDMKRFWEEADEQRDRMRRCNRYCAISHSVRRESATRLAQ